MDWNAISLSVITVSAGLGGVLLGGWVTGRHFKQERRNARCREQLVEFYAPLRGMRAEIRSKSDLRSRLHAIAQAEYAKKLEGVGDPALKKQISSEASEAYASIFDYSDDQLRTDLVPIYRRMMEHFSSHMAFAEPSTLAYFPLLVEFVEVWNRHLKCRLPTEVVMAAEHEEKNLYAFYDDVESHYNRLIKELKE